MDVPKDLADIIAETCYKQYAKLPKTGKPNKSREWTLLAGVVKMIRQETSSVQVVSLGTGSKCIGQSKMSPDGDIVNDSHAEIMARRGFLRYLYHQVQLTYETEVSDIFELNKKTGKCVLKPEVSFHFFTSHTPCGDASIIPKTTSGVSQNTNVKRKSDQSQSLDTSSESLESSCKRPKLENEICSGGASQSKEPVTDDVISVVTGSAVSGGDITSNEEKISNVTGTNQSGSDIYRTGAKCVPGVEQDPKLPGTNYHSVSVLRTKPGRGDRTLSHSCSDKMAKWNVLGIQGALLSLFIEKPIYLQSYVVGLCPYSEEVMRRAVVERCSTKLSTNFLPEPYKMNESRLLQASLAFADGEKGTCNGNNSKRPCPSSIVWIQVPDRSLEVAVEGRKQGVTKKALKTRAGRLSICKKELLIQFVELIKKIKSDSVADCISQIGDVAKTPYWQLKALAVKYQEVWRTVQEKSFPSWLRKPESLLQFTAEYK